MQGPSPMTLSRPFSLGTQCTVPGAPRCREKAKRMSTCSQDSNVKPQGVERAQKNAGMWVGAHDAAVAWHVGAGALGLVKERHFSVNIASGIGRNSGQFVTIRLVLSQNLLTWWPVKWR